MILMFCFSNENTRKWGGAYLFFEPVNLDLTTDFVRGNERL